MRVEIGLSADTIKYDSNRRNDEATSNDGSLPSNNNNIRSHIYLEGLKDYPDEHCHPEINGTLAIFQLSLSDFYECGVTRMINQLTVNCPFIILTTSTPYF